jgi:hypothetical protein
VRLCPRKQGRTSSFGEEAFVDQAAKMAYLGYRANACMFRPSAALVAEYARRFGLRLPPAYRRFLLRFGGYCGSAYCPLQEPAPYEDPVEIGPFLGFWPPGCDTGDVRRHTEWLRRFAPPVFVPVTLACHGSCVVAIKCGGSDAGHVYLFDEEGRAEGDNPEQLPVVPAHLRCPSMERYLELRRARRLPAKPDDQVIVAPSGLKVALFRLATSFEEFVAALQRPEERLGRRPNPPPRSRAGAARPLNRLYCLLGDGGDHPYTIDFDRRRRVIWFACGLNRAGAAEEEEDGRIRVCYQSSEVDMHSEWCTPDEAVALIEAIMSRPRLIYLPKPAAEPAPPPGRGGVTASGVHRPTSRRGR